MLCWMSFGGSTEVENLHGKTVLIDCKRGCWAQLWSGMWQAAWSSDVKPDTCFYWFALMEQVLLLHSHSTHPHLMSTFIIIRLNYWNRTQITQLSTSWDDTQALSDWGPGSFHLVALPTVSSPFIGHKMFSSPHVHSVQWDGGWRQGRASRGQNFLLGHKDMQERLARVVFYCGQPQPDEIQVLNFITWRTGIRG